MIKIHFTTIRASTLIVLLQSVCVLLLSLSPIHAVDLFGEEKIAEGELSMADQSTLYDQFFGEMDQAASNSSKRLKLAIQLKSKVDEKEFEPLRRFILRRIESLCEDSKKKEAYDLQVFVFNEFYKTQERSREQNVKLKELLEKQLSKSGGEEKTAIIGEISGILNENCQFSLIAKNYEQAEDDYKALASWLSKAKDKENAQLAKNMTKVISDYTKAKEKNAALQEKADADPTDIKSNAAVGLFYASEAEWEKAHKYLKNGQELNLLAISQAVPNKEIDSEGKANCVVTISKVLKEKSVKKDRNLMRTLLQVGVVYRSELNLDPSGLSPAMKIQYGMLSKNFEDQLEALGPNPLGGIEISGSGSSIDEERLMRMGWEQIFDHEKTCILSPESKGGLVFAEVKKRNLIIKVKPGGYKYMILKDNGYKGIKMRIKTASTNPGVTFGLAAAGQGIPELSITRDNTVIWGKNGGNGGGEKFGSQEFIENDWNDLTIMWDGKEAKASLNGKFFEKAIPFEVESLSYVRFNIGTQNSEREYHIQSLLGLKK